MKKGREGWSPSYTSGKGHLVQINGINSEECPVSLTDGWIYEMLTDYSEASRFEGCSMYGPDLSRWPADVFDAFAIFQYEENRIQNAKMDRDQQQ